VASEQIEPAAADDDEDRGSWHLRGVGASFFAFMLLLAGLGGAVLFSRDGIEVGWARWQGVPGIVTIENCAHSSSYALCYGPFDASDGSIRRKRLELRTLRHDRPGRPERTWLPRAGATHAWAADVSPWNQLLPAAPFALLALIQTIWITVSWRGWRRRREAARNRSMEIDGLLRPVGAVTAPSPAIAAVVTAGNQDHPQNVTVGRDRRSRGWQDLRGTAMPPGPSTPQPRARRQPWERPEHG
jgi:hypothetical protein